MNLTKLYEEVRDKGESGGALFNAAVSTPEAAADTAAGGLTQAELTGISKLEGVRSKEALDKAWAWTATLWPPRTTPWRRRVAMSPPA